jgi:N utilization substance protein B
MDRVDRNVVRMATAELLLRTAVPRAAILSEAVRLAGRYGSDRSASFVNGLVEALAKRLRPGPEPGASA